MPKKDYIGNMVADTNVVFGEITGPYLLITKREVPPSMAGPGPGGYEIDKIYQFSTKKELEEALKVLEGIPVKTLEAKISHEVKVEE